MPVNLIKVGRIEEVSSETVNRVTVYGYLGDGTELSKTIEDSDVASGEKLAIEFIYSSKDLDTQAKVDALATYLYDLYNKTPWRFEAEFRLRTDLELLQKIQFLGYEEVPEDEMRIIGIEYNRKTADTRVKINFVKDQPLSQLKFKEPSISDIISDVIVDDDEAGIEVGTVQNIVGDDATVLLESGQTVVARILNP
jgi:hypothetical protein